MKRVVVLSVPDNRDRHAAVTVTKEKWLALLGLVRTQGGLVPFGNLTARHANFFAQALRKGLRSIEKCPTQVAAHQRGSSQFIRPPARDEKFTEQDKADAEAIIKLCEQGRGVLIAERFVTS